MNNLVINFISFLLALIIYGVLSFSFFKLTNPININPIIWLFSVIIIFGTPAIIFRITKKNLQKKFISEIEVNRNNNNVNKKLDIKNILALIILLIPLIFLGINKLQIFSSGNCITGDCVNGQGTKVFYKTGAKYIGNFKNSEFNGYGILILSNGDKLEGNWSDSYLNGQGTLITNEGVNYKGEFSKSAQNGHGTWSYMGNTYIGEFKNSEFNGQGTMTLSDGSKYTGEFKNGNYDGKGILTDANGKVKSGIWKKDKFIHP